MDSKVRCLAVERSVKTFTKPRQLRRSLHKRSSSIRHIGGLVSVHLAPHPQDTSLEGCAAASLAACPSSLVAVRVLVSQDEGVLSGERRTQIDEEGVFSQSGALALSKAGAVRVLSLELVRKTRE